MQFKMMTDVDENAATKDVKYCTSQNCHSRRQAFLNIYSSSKMDKFSSILTFTPTFRQ